MTGNKTENDTVMRPGEVSEVSPHNRALYEAGKSLLVESISTGREFCKYMTGTAMGAIPVYFALLKFVLPKDYVLRSQDEFYFLAPAVLFLASSVIFAIGYFPTKGKLSLDLPDEIERERSAAIKRRARYSAWGFTLFCVGIVIGVWITLRALSSSDGLVK